jgi:hypothetical protein
MLMDVDNRSSITGQLWIACGCRVGHASSQ